MTWQPLKTNRTLFIKQCPRCNGDIIANKDQYGEYIHCLQCGYMADVPRPNPIAMLRTRIVRDDVA